MSSLVSTTASALSSAWELGAKHPGAKAVRGKLGRVPAILNSLLDADMFEGLEDEGFGDLSVPRKSPSLWRSLDIQFYTSVAPPAPAPGALVYVQSRAAGNQDILVVSGAGDEWSPDVLESLVCDDVLSVADVEGVHVRVRASDPAGVPSLEFRASSACVLSEFLDVACGAVCALWRRAGADGPAAASLSVGVMKP